MNKGSALILILLSGAVFYSFTSPQYEDTKALAASAREYRDVLDNVSRITTARDNLLANYETIPAIEKDRLAKALPDNVDVVGLARELDTVASRYGIAITRVQIDGGENRNTPTTAEGNIGLPYEKALVSFTFVSNYPNFIKFLADLEKSLRIMDVKSASFQTSESGIYEHKITVQTYWLK